MGIHWQSPLSLPEKLIFLKFQGQPAFILLSASELRAPGGTGGEQDGAGADTGR